MSDAETDETPAVTVSMPDGVSDALMNLTPKQAAAVRAYTTRTSPGYGHKAKSKRLAGYSEKTATYQVFSHEDVKHAIRQIREWQLEEAETVLEEIRAVAPEAKDEIVSQLNLGKSLDIIDPRDIFGSGLEEVEGKDDHARLQEINKHNRVVAKFAKERREAAELLLAYAEGTPEQRMHVTRGTEKTKLEEILEGLPKDEFDEVGKILFGEEGWPEEAGTPDTGDAPAVAGEEGEVVEGDYEIVD